MRYTNGYRIVALPLLLMSMLLVSCAINEELMIGSGQGLSLPQGNVKLPNNPAVIGALAGAKVYRHRYWLLGGDHVIEASSGSKYQHALTQSLQHVVQALGLAYGAWTSLQIQLGKYALQKFEAGEITKQQLQNQLFEIDKLNKTVPNPNDGFIETAL